MIRYNALDRWLLPGGHLDPADPGPACRGAARARRGDRHQRAAGGQPARPRPRPARRRPAPHPRQPGQERARALARRLPLRLPRDRTGRAPAARGSQRLRLAVAGVPADHAPCCQSQPASLPTRPGASRGGQGQERRRPPGRPADHVAPTSRQVSAWRNPGTALIVRGVFARCLLGCPGTARQRPSQPGTAARRDVHEPAARS